MVVCGRGPYLAETALGHEAFVSHRIPEWTADGSGVGSPIEHGAHYFDFTGSGITVLANVAVETQRLVVGPLAHALLLQKVNGKNRGVSTIATAKRERSTLQIRERRDRTSGNCNDLGHPA